jgi:hypothetical protein
MQEGLNSGAEESSQPVDGAEVLAVSLHYRPVSGIIVFAQHTLQIINSFADHTFTSHQRFRT